MKPIRSAPLAGWVWVAVIALAILHQDFWWWSDSTLIGGVVPIGLFYHILFSLAAAALWALAVKFAWPSDLEEWAEGSSAAERPDRRTNPGERR